MPMNSSWNKKCFTKKSGSEIKTYIPGSIIFFSDNHIIYEIMWKNLIKPVRPPITI